MVGTMIIDLRHDQNLPLIPAPATIPCCRVDKIGPYGLYFANRPGVGRVAPGTNYLYAMLAWRAMWSPPKA
jgi:hypothetical protein